MAQFKLQMSNIMTLAWQFVKKNGYTMSEALKVAWRNFKLKNKLQEGIVRFYFQKVDGTIREAFGTTDPTRYHYEAKGFSRPVPSDCFRYWDTVKGGFRMFKKHNLLKVVL